ncbi:polysaccharide biosynthesis/export family protein [Phaeobacter gallaeciensis]|uniref:polysaccharide biosynthesis/export family protein n=1 Tax=Phaeobacter gallaeciensis TaxID=60890 RepID=UPI00237F5E6D|nr:polysaccharide biosynthesis/export family protein [Phaeobacter gallaeciensis]MDE4142401.1 polysaccharide biosynthesis/export family protein [Phaeobacter gallaeciensis]MDE4150846.1 polysaccharide biosynthesis/export family protein [Phaeobacter gallaeciensis]MDE4155075.1 polysaccharide biosynthesis/export family protein [Phaeobacter gallaeciensis]MDE4230465.1 polysaccharide biosynthesis/export family protein [Phaeobacter gallaeciensis]MDE4259542.1 polysaccharide biosynthesis/export family pro
MRSFISLLAAVSLALLSAACGRLPSGAPVSEEILAQSSEPDADFALYQVTRAFLPTVGQWPETGQKELLGWIRASQGAKTQIIQAGDTLTLRIWDSSDNSLLTSSEQKMVQLQDVRVASNGSVFMPYVGNVNVLGLTPDLAREKLQEELEAIVPSAQLQLDMAEGRGNSVDLVSGVARPGTYPMPDRNYTVMGLISAGGGISSNLNNPQIRLVRGSNIYGTSVQNLLNNPRLDTLLRGGDRVFVEEDERYFLSFGATGTEDLHIFTKDEMSAMDAISVSGGFQDSKADPEGLLVLREYPDTAVAPGQRGPRHNRVVFTLDLTTADGLFSARKFEINPGDLVIATESPVNDALTVSNLIGNFFGVFSRAGVL